MDNIIFVLNGPSASGKTTIIEGITEGINTKYEAMDDVDKIITVTTRPPRPGEINGIHYHFLTPEEYDIEDAKGNMVEKTENYGIRYGILDSEIKKLFNAKKDAIVALDKHGISEMKRFYGDKNVVSIYVHRDLKDIWMELDKRSISMEEKLRRFTNAKEEMKNISLCDRVIYNIGSIDDAVEEAKRIILEERNKRYER